MSDDTIPNETMTTEEQTPTNGAPTEPLAAEQDGAEQPAAEAPATSLEADLAEARRQADEYLDQWRRAAAEFQNYRKRQERERQDLLRSASGRLVERLLPVLDDLQRAAQHVPAELRDNEWVNGVLLVERKLWNILEAEGLRPIPVEPGTEFDPTVHDALLSEESEQYESGAVTQELERGYTLNERVLRAAKVKVAR